MKFAAIDAGLDHIPDIIYEHVDKDLFMAFVERWQPETSSFHLPFGEMTITLHDVYQQMKLPIRGRGMGSSEQQRLMGKQTQLTQKLAEARAFLGLRGKDSAVSHSMLRDTCCSRQCITATPHVAASGYLLHLLGSALFPDRSQDKIPLSNIDFVRDLDEVGEWAWGAGLLASTYRELGKASRAECKQISACYTLVMVSNCMSIIDCFYL